MDVGKGLQQVYAVVFWQLLTQVNQWQPAQLCALFDLFAFIKWSISSSLYYYFKRFLFHDLFNNLTAVSNRLIWLITVPFQVDSEAVFSGGFLHHEAVWKGGECRNGQLAGKGLLK